MIVPSDILGPLTVSEEEILTFPAGLLGLPDSRSFVLLGTEREGLYWLQSVEQSALAFLLIDPFLFCDGYSAEIAPADLAELQASDHSDIAVLAIVTLPRAEREKPTANLQGPLALNLRASRGKQIVMQDSEFGVRCPVDLESPAGAG